MPYMSKSLMVRDRATSVFSSGIIGSLAGRFQRAQKRIPRDGGLSLKLRVHSPFFQFVGEGWMFRACGGGAAILNPRRDSFEEFADGVWCPTTVRGMVS